MKKRIYDLIIKLISVKGTLAITSIVAFIRNPSEWTLWFAVVMCSLFVVGREYDKLLEVVKVIKGVR